MRGKKKIETHTHCIQLERGDTKEKYALNGGKKEDDFCSSAADVCIVLVL